MPLVAFAAVSAWRSRPSDDYGTLGQTVDSVVGALVLPEGIAVLVLCAYVTALGWWPIATVDRRRTTLRWTLTAPALIAAVCLARLPLVEWDAQPVRYFVLLGVGVLFVGVFEELLTRGVLLVGLRRRLPEFGVWIASCALFGLLHFLNVLAGAGVGVTVVQVVFAASFGSTLYLARRLTGNLLAPVLLHAAWDFGSIAVSATVPTQDLARMVPAGFIGLFAFAVLALGAGRRRRGRVAGRPGPSPRAPVADGPAHGGARGAGGRAAPPVRRLTRQPPRAGLPARATGCREQFARVLSLSRTTRPRPLPRARAPAAGAANAHSLGPVHPRVGDRSPSGNHPSLGSPCFHTGTTGRGVAPGRPPPHAQIRRPRSDRRHRRDRTRARVTARRQAATYPSDSTEPDLVSLLNGYDQYWTSSGGNDLHGTVNDPATLAKNDQLTSWINQHATTAQQFRALQDAEYDNTARTAYDQSFTVSQGSAPN